MRHAKQRLQLNRFTSWRSSTLISIAKNLLTREQIITTKVKARAAAPLVEKLISLAKKDSLTNRRLAYKTLGEHNLVSLLFKEVGPRFNNRNCGFTRILPWVFRRGDGAQLVILELTERKEKIVKPKKEKASLKQEIKEEAKETPREQAPTGKPKVITEQKKPAIKKPSKKFLGGLRKIFKKERDSL